VYSRTLSPPISGEKHLFVGLTTPSWKLPERSILSFVVCVFYDDVFFFFVPFSLVCEKSSHSSLNLSLRSLSALVLKSSALVRR
jgi:hypothetical protein